MSSIRKQHSNKLKAQIALEAYRNEKPLHEIGKEHGVHPIQVGKWRKELKERAFELFSDGRRKEKQQHNQEQELEKLYEQIGRLKVENDFLKKKSVTGY